MNSRTLLVGTILVLIVAGVLFISSSALRSSAPPAETAQPIGGGPGGNLTAPSAVKEFTVKGMLVSDPTTGMKTPRFDAAEIRAKKGDRVRINFENTEGFHDWVIDEFNARTKQIQAGQKDTTEFVADKAGTFQFYCSVPGHRQAGMVGYLIVED